MHAGRYLDDFSIGERFKADSFTLDEPKILEFAQKYDPQIFHTDIEAAKDGPYGGLISSGFQTLNLCFCKMVQSGVFNTVSMGGPGIDEIRFLLPVRPGDTIQTEAEILSIKPSNSKPDRGVMRIQYRGFNQNSEEVISFITIMIGKRNI
jgi:acyl dehydratase